ncbi:hypothetical protein [Larkinella soli]|uniref:hypothetical protein n=1 Tax=Larkinella soli TaxID=1770527 RepID=UPI000FFB90B4|nr:hypothetical protein [Larkinella soli]
MRTPKALLAGVLAAGLAACSPASNGVAPEPAKGQGSVYPPQSPTLFLVDGKPIETFKKTGVNIDDIATITVLKPGPDGDLVAKYGPEAKNGVILLETKKARKKATP